MPRLSSIVNTCGGIPLEHLRSLIRQLASFSDEVILFFDDITPAEFLEEAGRLTRDIRMLEHRASPQEFVGEMLSQCAGDFILRLNHDELLSPNWTRPFLEFLMSDRQVNSYWIARKWLVGEEGRYLSSPPHFPDYQARFTRNLPSIVHTSNLLHEPTRVAGDCGWISSHAILHYDLIWKSRAEREAKVQRYAAIRPENTCAKYYLYEDWPHTISELKNHGRFAAKVCLLDQPEFMVCGNEYALRLAVHNSSGRVLNSRADPQINLAYHWSAAVPSGARAVIWNGNRSPLRAADVLNHCVVQVVAPEEAGSYLLQIDLVEEGVAWFSEKAPNSSAFPLHPICVREAAAKGSSHTES